MKLVISRSYNGFFYSGRHWRLVHDCYNDRGNLTLVKMVEKFPEQFIGLVVVNIPEKATDYTIEEFDGFEVVFYVVDGKIHKAIE